MQSLELVKSSELIMVFRISKIHTNADFTFSNNTTKNLLFEMLYIYYLYDIIVKKECPHIYAQKEKFVT